MRAQANSDGLIKCLRQRQDSLVRGPEGHLTKLTGNLWARTLFFLLSDHQNEKHCPLLSNFGALPPALYRDFLLALSADALVHRFLLTI
jgi:hypothetical protein